MEFFERYELIYSKHFMDYKDSLKSEALGSFLLNLWGEQGCLQEVAPVPEDYL